MTDGVNLIGFLSANMGLGVAARNTASLLERKGIPVAGLGIQAGMGRSQPGDRIRDICVPNGVGLIHGVNLWHLNPPEVSNLMATDRLRIDWNRFNVCVPFWELTRIPPDWFEALDAMDLILAPTRYIENTLSARLDSARVRYFPQTLNVPEPAGWDRQALGLSAEDTVFVAAFDYGSGMDRKNPLGVLQAFLEAFRGHSRVHLLVKANNARMNAATERMAALLKESFAVHRNIRFLDQPMEYREVLALYQCADVYVSLHRAEGLGLGLMESMSLGKAVMGTGWSGNMEFMTDANSVLVRHRLVPVKPETMYGDMMKGMEAVWAEPDLEDAARWMRRLAADPGLRRSLGGRAAEDIRRHDREAGKGRALEELGPCRARWELRGPAGRRPAPKWTLPAPIQK
jgi:glycosyltransferase involved in cell wall biosynthesis